MFDIGWTEMLIVGVIAVMVVGPRDLPRLMRSIGHWVRKARMMASDFQGSIERMAEESDLAEVKRDIASIGNDIGASIDQQIDPTGPSRKADAATAETKPAKLDDKSPAKIEAPGESASDAPAEDASEAAPKAASAARKKKRASAAPSPAADDASPATAEPAAKAIS